MPIVFNNCEGTEFSSFSQDDEHAALKLYWDFLVLEKRDE